MGIITGQSTVVEAYKQVASVLKNFGYTLSPLESSWNGVEAFITMTDSSGNIDPNAFIFFRSQANLVDDVGVSLDRVDPMMPTFGDFVNLLGSPTCVAPWVGANTIGLDIIFNDSDDNVSFDVVMDTNRFSWTQPVLSFGMGQRNTDECEHRYPWHGLRNAEYYIIATQQ